MPRKFPSSLLPDRVSEEAGLAREDERNGTQARCQGQEGTPATFVVFLMNRSIVRLVERTICERETSMGKEHNMKVRSWLPALAAAFLIWPVTAGNERSGPEPNSEAALLHFDAFNDDGGEYCITCRAGQRPLAILFATKDTALSRNLINALEAQRKAHDNLQTAIVLLEGQGSATLKQLITDKGIRVPAGIISTSHRDWPNWHINTNVENTVVLIRGHKIRESVANLPSADLAAKVSALLQ